MAVGHSYSQAHVSKVGAQLLRLSNGPDHTFRPALVDDFSSKPVVLFIHGFTANAKYMSPMLDYFDSHGYSAIAYNYPCYNGIDAAAETLFDLLSRFNSLSDACLERNQIIVVGHSMGGLVARALVSLTLGSKFVRKVVTLGTPHAGTLSSTALLGPLVMWGESVSGLISQGYPLSSKSALQLLRQDSPPHLLDELNTSGAVAGVTFTSISGGKQFLEAGTNWLLTLAVNKFIQRHMRGSPNDGLVMESSSNLQLALLTSNSGCEHKANYSEYANINHTYLCKNQAIHLLVLEICKE